VKYNLLNVLLLNEKALLESTRLEMLELQALLIDHIEGFDDVDYSLLETQEYGVVILVKQTVGRNVKTCRIVKLIRKSMNGNSPVYGVKLPAKSPKLSLTVFGLIGDLYEWLHGTASW
jgi:hypothetical protein